MKVLRQEYKQRIVSNNETINNKFRESSVKMHG